MLRRALRDMLTTMPLGEVTVAELCRTAEVHRTTFYKHFATVGELAGQVAQDVLGLAVPAVPEGDEPSHRSWLTALFTLARDERAALLGLIGPSGDAAFSRAVSRQIIARTEHDLCAAVERGAQLPMTAAAVAQVLGSAYFGAVIAVLTTPLDEADIERRAGAVLGMVEETFLAS